MKIRTWVVLLSLMICDARCTLTPVLRAPAGRLRGVRSATGQYRYYSIPYATSDRFQLPKAPPKWKGIYNAINPFVRCPQKMSFFITGTEDCLYLDVYTPAKVRPRHKLPVMVFFHGGAYYKGSKELYDPQFLGNKDVIVVVINYRLGVLGFLCLNDVSNLGLRDQVAALMWVKRNIETFGGDPDNVTLCGQSAGASSASLHLITELSRGLFHKAILMSGTALSTWAFNIEPLTAAFDDARKLSLPLTEGDVFNSFAGADLHTLIEATHDNSVFLKNLRNPTPKKSKLLPVRWPAAADNSSNIIVINKAMKVIHRPRTDQRGDFYLEMLCTYGKNGYVPCESREMCQPR